MADDNSAFEMQFQHDWQRQAWDEEMARYRAGQARPRDDFGIGVDIASSLARLPAPVLDSPDPLTCGAAERWTSDDLRTGVVYCDGAGHHVVEGVIGRCPDLVKREVAAHVESERGRLAGELEKLRRLGGAGFRGFDTKHCEGAEEAFAAMREFAAGRPPQSGVFMVGTTGLGKTRLLLASHFSLLRAGVRSQYVTTPKLRAAFLAIRSFEEKHRRRGEELIDRLVRTQAVHLDDLGSVDKDERRRGEFTDGMQDLLDRSIGVWAAATNLTWEAALSHPDVGEKVVSRLMQGATVIKLAGEDYRISSARSGPG